VEEPELKTKEGVTVGETIELSPEIEAKNKEEAIASTNEEKTAAEEIVPEIEETVTTKMEAEVAPKVEPIVISEKENFEEE